MCAGGMHVGYVWGGRKKSLSILCTAKGPAAQPQKDARNGKREIRNQGNAGARTEERREEPETAGERRSGRLFEGGIRVTSGLAKMENSHTQREGERHVDGRTPRQLHRQLSTERRDGKTRGEVFDNLVAGHLAGSPAKKGDSKPRKSIRDTATAALSSSRALPGRENGGAETRVAEIWRGLEKTRRRRRLAGGSVPRRKRGSQTSERPRFLCAPGEGRSAWRGLRFETETRGTQAEKIPKESGFSVFSRDSEKPPGRGRH